MPQRRAYCFSKAASAKEDAPHRSGDFPLKFSAASPRDKICDSANDKARQPPIACSAFAAA
jgi:hypothetical protein